MRLRAAGLDGMGIVLAILRASRITAAPTRVPRNKTAATPAPPVANVKAISSATTTIGATRRPTTTCGHKEAQIGSFGTCRYMSETSLAISLPLDCPSSIPTSCATATTSPSPRRLMIVFIACRTSGGTPSDSTRYNECKVSPVSTISSANPHKTPKGVPAPTRSFSRAISASLASSISPIGARAPCRKPSSSANRPSRAVSASCCENNVCATSCGTATLV